MIEKLFTSKNRVKILGFLFFEKEESYIREIARELNMSSSIIKREVDNLSEIGVIKKTGRRIILDKENIFFNDLRNILIKSDFILYPIKTALNDFNLDFVVLYGSYAKGNFNSDSDVDLFIIGNVSLSKIYSTLDSIGEDLGKEINSVVWSSDELKKKKGGAFVRDILKNKKVMIIGGKDEFERIIRQRKN